jgi:hypothetical protein
MSETAELLVQFWQTVREYIPAKDRQIAADHVINELVELGISDLDLQHLACDRIMTNSISEHLDVQESDEEDYDE